MDTNKVGLVFAAFFAGAHFIWSLMVLTGMGQWFMDFVFWAHMIHVQMTIGPFDVAAAGSLLVLTTVIGYLMGCMAALLWKKIHPVV
jgi:hypothetical protein